MIHSNRNGVTTPRRTVAYASVYRGRQTGRLVRTTGSATTESGTASSACDAIHKRLLGHHMGSYGDLEVFEWRPSQVRDRTADAVQRARIRQRVGGW